MKKLLLSLLLSTISFCSIVDAFGTIFPTVRHRINEQANLAATRSSLLRRRPSQPLPPVCRSSLGSSAADVIIPSYPRWKAALVRTAMLLYIASMCVALPATLLPQKLVGRLIPESKWSVAKRQRLALLTGQYCARQLLKIIPFCRLECQTVCATGTEPPVPDKNPSPTIWVCNHTSMLDIFLLLAGDKRLRGKYRRPIQVVYWKDLEKNPVTRLLFKQAGFIAVQMADNGNGNANEYDKSSFKQLLKQCKQSIADGFDIGLLPEGQLNPTPHLGLLPVFSGAQFLAKLAKRPIQFMALHGAHHLWHPAPEIDMKILGRHVKAQKYWPGRYFESPQEFSEAFSAVVGEFGKNGQDLPQHELDEWLLASRKGAEAQQEVLPNQSSTADGMTMTNS